MRLRHASTATLFAAALLGMHAACSTKDDSPSLVDHAGAGNAGASSDDDADRTPGSGGAPQNPSDTTPDPPVTQPVHWGPPHHAVLLLQPLNDGRFAYLPHIPKPHRVKGSGHTHCAPDHSGITARAQQERLRDLPAPHAHGFVWMTCHTFVAPDPDVSGIVHLFGAEVYTAKQPESQSEPHVLAYLPSGDLADPDARPFGYFKHDLETASQLVREAGGVLAWAHPSRDPLTDDELEAIDDLWGMEVVSGATDIEENLKFVDRRLSAGHYVCLTGGGDIHAEDYRLTRGYQLVEADSAAPSRQELFEAITSCNFFVCDVQDTKLDPLEPPQLSVVDGALHFSVPRTADTIRFVGKGGNVLHEVSSTDAATYTPTSADLYVRVEAHADEGQAACYSQPVWLVEDP